MKDLNPAKWVYVDFETKPIRPRPDYPPEPVGVAIKWPGKPAKYLAFAHPGGGNNCTVGKARVELVKVWDSDHDVCFHNAKFDLSVAYEFFKLAPLPWKRIHDTMLMLFLRDPRAKTYKLKANAEVMFGRKPETRDAILDWLVAQQPVPGVRLTLTEHPAKSKSSKAAPLAYAGAYIAYAPPELVGPYACNDVELTEEIAVEVAKDLTRREMVAAYDRERGLFPPILAMEDEGVPVDLKRLREDVDKYTETLAAVDFQLCKLTGAPPDTHWDSSATLTGWLRGAGLADEGKLGVTKTGKVASNKKALDKCVDDRGVRALLAYRSRLCVSLRTFMRPWLEVAEKSGGHIFTTWNTTRTDENGARTGRLSSTPNFQNLPKKPVKLFADGEAKPDWWAFPELPHVRGYIVPYKGHVLVGRDASQQELRILAHYVDGDLLARYQANNWLDTHALAQERVSAMLGVPVERGAIKTTVFGLVYGMGLEKLAAAIGKDEAMAERIRAAVLGAIPGLRELNDDLKAMARKGEEITTWGGRKYACEPRRMVLDEHGNPQWKSYEYKLLNLLIQGSAADHTKQAMVNLWRAMRAFPAWRLLLTVHDEFLLSVPRKDEHKAHKVLAAAMAGVDFFVPMLSEGKTGKTWATMQAHDEKGKRCGRKK